MSSVDGWVLEGCSGAVGRNRPWMDQTDWTARSSGVRRTLAESDLVGVVTMTRPRATRGGSGCRIIGVRRRRFWPRLELARRVLVAARVRVLRVSGDDTVRRCTTRG